MTTARVSFWRFRRIVWLAAALVLLGGAVFWRATKPLAFLLRRRAEMARSPVAFDRHGVVVWVQPNGKGAYSLNIDAIPAPVTALLLRREDRWFFVHPGVNPLSVLRAVVTSRGTSVGGSSTITQQLVKNLFGSENRREWRLRVAEAFAAVALELHSTKDEILRWYLESAYLGQRMQGIVAASWHYFGLPPHALNTSQSLALVAALNQPEQRAPGTIANRRLVAALAKRWGIDVSRDPPLLPAVKEDDAWRTHPAAFELKPYLAQCRARCQLTIDAELTQKLRELLRRNLTQPSIATVQNGAIVAIRTSPNLSANEILAIVGSPNPAASHSGLQLNSAIAPRPIGSTVKPFIYLKAFAQGLRPYTLVEDREYRYEIGTGFALYPKNYDGRYRGTVTLHRALANSLNVPTVKVVEYVGLDALYRFLSGDLGWRPPQPFESYELSVALGGLELDLLTLTESYTVLSRAGIRLPLRLSSHRSPLPPSLTNGQLVGAPRIVADPAVVELVNRILSDRQAGVEQFGMASNLNLPYPDYAVKTGTSRDFHDSWTVGYTPDFVVGVWLGNSDNTPMESLSGQTGAGRIWREAMEILLQSPYHERTPFSFRRLIWYDIDGSVEYGLAGDAVETRRELLRENTLILQPHDHDTVLLDDAVTIPLRSRRAVVWLVNGSVIGRGQTVRWQPKLSGTYRVTARDESTGEREEISVVVNAAEEW